MTTTILQYVRWGVIDSGLVLDAPASHACQLTAASLLLNDYLVAHMSDLT